MHSKTLWFLLFLPLIIQAQPDVVWRKNLKNNIQSINSATAIALDKSGNVFVFGTTHERDSTKQMLLFKLEPDGKEQWRRLYKIDKMDASAVAMAIDGGGNILLTGTVKNESGNTDIITLKYSTTGILLWENKYAGRANLFDAPTAIAVDRKNNVVVCGYETVNEANPDLLLIRYRANSDQSFVRNYSSRELDMAVAVGTDDSCNVYVCGSIEVGIRAGDLTVMKYDSAGKSRWNYVYDGISHSIDQASDMIVDDSAMIYVTGSVNRENDKSDVPLFKINRNGKLLCERLINEGVADGIGNNLVVEGKSVLLHATFTDYLQQTVIQSIHLNERGCRYKSRLVPSSEDVTYVKAFPWKNKSLLLFGSILSRPENTIAPYIEGVDSLYHTIFVYHDDVMVSLLRIKDVLLSGRDIYFLGDDATENAGAIAVAKLSFPAEQNKKTKAPNQIQK